MFFDQFLGANFEKIKYTGDFEGETLFGALKSHLVREVLRPKIAKKKK